MCTIAYIVPNAPANQMSVNISSVPDRVFVLTWGACSLISSFKDVATTLRSQPDTFKKEAVNFSVNHNIALNSVIYLNMMILQFQALMAYIGSSLVSCHDPLDIL